MDDGQLGTAAGRGRSSQAGHTAPDETDSEHGAPRAGRGEWVGLAVLVLPCLLVSMDMSVLSFALPFLSADLEPDSSQLLWIMDVYGFLLAGLLITMGTLGDRIGRRRLLLIGAAAFGLSSILAAYSTSATMLILSRAVMGVAGATLAPSTLSLIRNMFHDPAQRRGAIAIWTAGFSGGALVGPLVGGLLLEAFWWGSVFLINVPFMVLLLALGRFLLPEFRPARAGRFDLASAALSTMAVLMVIYGVKEYAEGGLGPVAALFIVSGLAIGAAFVMRQRRLVEPLIDLGLFAHRAFGTAIAVSTVTMFAMVGFLFFTSQYLQLVLGMRPFTAALWNLPVVAVMPVGALAAASLVRRTGAGTVVAAGLAMIAAGFAVVTQVRPGSGLAVLLVGLGVMVIGISAVMALASDLVVGAAPPDRAGAASAISETGAELGGALGIALLGSVGTAVYRAELGESAHSAGLPSGVIDMARETLPAAVKVADQLAAPLAEALRDSAFAAFTQGMQVAAIVSALLMAGMAVFAGALLRR
ncbi:MFS transporter [Actinopolymorpha sp. B9G3]|uniref:MFS transporter n=1 Tax=Actinopolymorpha sp. B9G3 TaxID=3158970 RepID=UPI0032D8EE96